MRKSKFLCFSRYPWKRRGALGEEGDSPLGDKRLSVSGHSNEAGLCDDNYSVFHISLQRKRERMCKFVHDCSTGNQRDQRHINIWDAEKITTLTFA